MFAYEYKFVLSKSSLVPLLSSALEDPRRGGGEVGQGFITLYYTCGFF